MGQRISRKRSVVPEKRCDQRHPPQIPKNVVESDYSSAHGSRSEVKSSSGSLVLEIKSIEEEHVQEDIQQVDESSVSSEKSLKIQRPDEDKDQDEEFFKDWDKKSLSLLDDFSFSSFSLKDGGHKSDHPVNEIHRPEKEEDREKQNVQASFSLSDCLEDFSFSGLSMQDERHEAEEQVDEIHRPEKAEDLDQQNVKASDEKSFSLSKCLDDFSVSGVSLKDEKHEAEEQIYEIHLPDKEEDQDEDSFKALDQKSDKEESSDTNEDQAKQEDKQVVVQEVVKRITKEEWKKRLVPNTEDVPSLYKIGKQLGKGGYGSVYEAERRSDGLQVALKYVDKTPDVKFLRVPGHRKDLPSEVAIMMIMQKDYLIPQILQLLEWFEEPDRYILVLERPANSEDLKTFTERSGGRVDENTARIIMRQVVTAAQECCKRGVFHRDIKLENLLVNRTTLQVKLIDFGCSIHLKKGYEKSIAGTEPYFPPEVYIKEKYRGKPATVWSLGMLLYRLVIGRYPFAFELHRMYDATWGSPEFSDELCRLMMYSLQFKDKKRIKMKKMHEHDWLKMEP